MNKITCSEYCLNNCECTLMRFSDIKIYIRYSSNSKRRIVVYGVYKVNDPYFHHKGSFHNMYYCGVVKYSRYLRSDPYKIRRILNMYIFKYKPDPNFIAYGYLKRELSINERILS